MSQFRFFTSLFLSVLMFFSSSMAFAVNKTLYFTVNSANYSSSVADMKSHLHEIYTDQSDRKEIDKAMAQLKSVEDKWLWRFEVMGEKIVLRLNGKVQYSVDPVEDKPGHYKVNGYEYVYSANDSFLKSKMKLEKLIQRKQALMDRLFFQKADAWLIFAGLAVLGVFLFSRMRKANAANRNGNQQQNGAQVAASSPQNVIQCIQSSYVNEGSTEANTARGSGHEYYNQSRMCPGMHRNLESRVKLIAENFERGRRFRDVNDCATKKNKACNYSGWNMTPRNAMAHCKMAHQIYKKCKSGSGYNSSGAQQPVNPVAQ